MPPEEYDTVTFSGQYTGYVVVNTTTIQLRQNTVFGVSSNILDSNFADTSAV